MKRTTLPPTLADYAAGRDIAPLWIAPSGRAFYPIAGGADDPPADPPTDQPPGTPPADPPSDPGFPASTPLEQMTPEQQVAYYRHQARKHEDRNKDILKLTGGRYGDDLKALFDELDTLRTEKLTDSEKAVEEARRTAREEAAREFGPKMARLAFETALAHRDDRDDLIAALNLTSVLTESGDVDTAKVRSIVEKIAPADKGTGGERHDFGAGRRGGTAKAGVGAGAEMYQSSRKKSSSTT